MGIYADGSWANMLTQSNVSYSRAQSCVFKETLKLNASEAHTTYGTACTTRQAKHVISYAAR